MDNDSETFLEREQFNCFCCYCTFVMLVVGKKLNYVNIFIHTIKNKYLTDEESIQALKQICSKMGYVIDEE